MKSATSIGSVTSLPIIALMYLAYQLTSTTFPPFDLFDWLARVLTGIIITLTIDFIVALITILNFGQSSEVAKLIEQLMAFVLFILLGGLFGILIAILGQPQKKHPIATLATGGCIGFLIALLFSGINIRQGKGGQLFENGIWLSVLFIGWGIVIGYLLVRLPAIGKECEDDSDLAESRRKILYRLAATSAAITLGSLGIYRFFRLAINSSGPSQPLMITESLPSQKKAQVLTPMPLSKGSVENPQSSDLFKPAPGTRSELTANDDFYRIDISSLSPSIEEANWVLETRGLFEHPQNMSLEHLMAFPTYTQPITMSCISNRIGGDLIGTSNWTGLRLRDLIAELGLMREADSLFIEAIDGFFETVVMEDVLDDRTLLVYGMNGETLPQEHGFPLRIYIPNRYGMKQPKWITRITAVEDVPEGYWVKRGWSRDARPQIVSVIDVIATDQPTAEGFIPIGGIAWAGDRGILKVELQFDGDDWVEATLHVPPLSPLTWVQWRYDWIGKEGRHKVQVRATDGNRDLQIKEETGVRPDGATGYHERDFRF